VHREYLEKAAVVQKPGESGYYTADAHMLAAGAAGARNDILYEVCALRVLDLCAAH
jgi:hypothetical protein